MYIYNMSPVSCFQVVAFRIEYSYLRVLRVSCPRVMWLSLDNIDVLSPWRVESEEPFLEESPSWLEPVADDPLEQGQQEEDSES